MQTAVLVPIAVGCTYAALRGNGQVVAIIGGLAAGVVAFIALAVFFRIRSQR
jgi:hypothetical protein